MTLGYRPALDGIRALAILAVVLGHATGFPASGYLGVDIFFVLSGFLITTLLLDERLRTGAVSLRAFYRRRAYRLLPALFFLLAVFVVVSALGVLANRSPFDEAIFGVLAGLGYFSNFAIATEAGARAMPSELTHLWSLAAEEQFYIVWPAVLFVVLQGRLRLALGVLVGGLLLTTAEQLRLFFEGASWARIGFGVDTRSTSILVGCLLAVLLASGARPRVEAAARWVGPPAIVALGILLLWDPGRAVFAGPLLLAAIGSAMLILLALDTGSLLARALSTPPLVFLGRISYSLYLWHLPVFVAFGISGSRVELMDLPALGVALACAIGSYYLVEMPFLRRKREIGKADAHETARETGRRSPDVMSLQPAGHAEATA